MKVLISVQADTCHKFFLIHAYLLLGGEIPGRTHAIVSGQAPNRVNQPELFRTLWDYLSRHLRYSERMMDVMIEDARWSNVGLETIVGMAEKAVSDAVSMPLGSATYAVLACDDARIAVLNADFREKPSPTNVLSWPEEDLAAEEDGAVPARPTPDPDGTLSLGDIAIAYETCAREASEQGKSMEHHVTHLIVHGLLHLLGYDHIRSGDATRMEALEVKILGKLGIPDPY